MNYRINVLHVFAVLTIFIETAVGVPLSYDEALDGELTAQQLAFGIGTNTVRGTLEVTGIHPGVPFTTDEFGIDLPMHSVVEDILLVVGQFGPNPGNERISNFSPLVRVGGEVSGVPGDSRIQFDLTGAFGGGLPQPTPGDQFTFNDAIQYSQEAFYASVGVASIQGFPGDAVSYSLAYEWRFDVATAPGPYSPVLDQESFGPVDRSPAFNSRIGGGGAFDRAQSFVAGQSGMLAEVELYLKRNEQSALPLLLDIREVGVDSLPIDESNPSGILGSIAIPATDVPVDGGWVDVDLSTLDLQIVEGQQLALVLQSEEDLGAAVGEYAWFGSREGSYLPGAAFERRFSGGWEFSTGVNVSDMPDFYFRTYVTVVPEPTTASLALLALAVLGRRLGRKCMP